jgi:ribonuclease R
MGAPFAARSSASRVGVFVTSAGSFEGFLPARNLPDDYFAMNLLGTALVGRRTQRRYRLGDPVTVQVVRIDKVIGKVELALAQRPGGRAGSAQARATGARRWRLRRVAQWRQPAGTRSGRDGAGVAT